MRRTINNKGLQLIEEFEGLSLTPYLCPAGIPTIGIGCTRYEDGTKVTLNDPDISLDRAIKLLTHELQYFCNALDSFIVSKNLYIGDNKFSALVCFAFNVGLSPVITNGKLMHDGLLDQNSEKIKKAFLAYTKATVIKNGVAKKIELPGLVRRRKAEMELFFS